MAQNREISLVLGTAGHIDHGKTTLVKAVTGVDCDRLREEKKRGITIELGFAPLALDDGRVVSIVDVPGHERFIRQMVAGASGIDGVLLVVAADEGVMPQTREHLDILKLLGVRDGLVAVTKADMVEEDFLELVREDVEEFLIGSFLEGKPVVPVSAYSGFNLPLMREELGKLVDRIRPRSRKGPFFLPIDRSFPMAGFGAVVTGTAYRGEISPGMEAAALPSGREGRIRTVQVHNSTVDVAHAGQRVAVSVAGMASEGLSRGDVLCAKNVFQVTRCFECELSLLSGAPGPIRHWQRVRLHLGTSDVVARVALLESPLVRPGEKAPAQIVTEEDIVCLIEQRFILRRYSPLETIAGGRVLYPYGSKPKGKKARRSCIDRIEALSAAPGSEEKLLALVRSFSSMELSRGALSIQESIDDTARYATALKDKGEAFFIQGEKKIILSKEYYGELASGVEAFLRGYHEDYPSRKGAPQDSVIHSALKIFDAREARSFIEALVAEGSALLTEEGLLKLKDFEPRDDEAFERGAEKILSLCRERVFQPPLISEARERLALTDGAFSALLKGMREAGLISIVAGEFLLSSEMEERLLRILLEFKDDISVARVRDLTGSSRKFILPLLEYLDSRGYTRRAGEKRVLLASKLPSSVMNPGE